MPNYCSNYFSTTNPDIIARLKEAVTVGDDNGGTIKDLLGIFVPIPEPIKRVTTGRTTIDGQQVEVWIRNPDGTDTAIPADTLAAWRAAYGHDNWYDWSVAHWSTKWDTDGDAEFHRHPEGDWALVRFSTAWAPPLKWLATVVALHPQGETVLAYAESGNGFFGTTVYRDGELEEDSYSQDMFDPSKEWDDDTDYLDMLTEAAQAHSEEYGVI